jgi:hypothetical protein
VSLERSTTSNLAALPAQMLVVHIPFCEMIRIQIWVFVLGISSQTIFREIGVQYGIYT